ncbi:hypothetical protein ABT236_35290 [Streptomyces sp. NPDC001523]|uniref:hypothetical protein n=1 Tax=Streptomyces sp. NPDC001523 TaxID=3154383 RepID=UPI00332A1AB2
MPDAHREAWATVRAAHAAGDLSEALAQAQQLERAPEAEYGHLYPCTITVLTARGWLTLCRRSDWPGTVELLITTALRRHSIGARPQADTVRAARNAHAVWRLEVLPVDPEAALGLADPLADMLAIVGEPELRRDVLTRAGEAFTRKPARQAAG